jgi:hypothetical protein
LLIIRGAIQSIKLSFLSIIRARGKELITASLTFPTEKTHKHLIYDLISRLAPVKSFEPLIRIGPDGDGGYLVPNDLDSIYALFSPGVSTISGFEKDCAVKGIRVFLADKSVDSPAEDDMNFVFTKKFIGCVDDKDFMTLESWIKTSLPADSIGDLILQMDIENAEYESILSLPSFLLRRFRVIIVEFHSLDQLWSRPFFNLASRAFAKLLQYHSCVHIHPNNCCGSFVFDGLEIPRVAEFTFLRNDRGILPHYATDFPHPLDVDNTSKAPLRLPKCWIRND